VMLINASEKFKPLQKSKGSKKNEVDEISRQEIVATLSAYQDNDYARVFDKEFFYFNKQAIMLTNIDIEGKTLETNLPMKQDKFGELKRLSSLEIKPIKVTQGELEITEFNVTKYDKDKYASLENYFIDVIKPKISMFNYKEQPLVITTTDAKYYFDADQETLVMESAENKEALGCGKIIISAVYKKPTKKLPEHIQINVELTADYQKDYEIIPFHRDEIENKSAIDAFMAHYISRPFEYLENVIGVELNFNKIFYQPEKLRDVGAILDELLGLDEKLKALEQEILL